MHVLFTLGRGMRLPLGLCHCLLNRIDLGILRNSQEVCKNYLHAEVLGRPVALFTSTLFPSLVEVIFLLLT